MEATQQQAIRLSIHQRALLDFERDWRLHQGFKNAAVRQSLGMSSARYYRLLNELLDKPEALAYDPMTVRRLRRRRARRHDAAGHS